MIITCRKISTKFPQSNFFGGRSFSSSTEKVDYCCIKFSFKKWQHWELFSRLICSGCFRGSIRYKAILSSQASQCKLWKASVICCRFLKARFYKKTLQVLKVQMCFDEDMSALKNRNFFGWQRCKLSWFFTVIFSSFTFPSVIVYCLNLYFVTMTWVHLETISEKQEPRSDFQFYLQEAYLQ